jgi:dTDP-glucose 4,6-dehydratase
MKILVTGGAGFIGSNYINSRTDDTVVCLDKIDYCSNPKNLKECIFVKGDIRNKELVEYLINIYKFDRVIHFAAQSHVDNSFVDPLSFTDNNINGTHVLIDAFMRHHPSVEFIHFSTDEVYGESLDGQLFTESEGVLAPTNPYSASKAAAEMIVQSYIMSYDMNVKIIRCNNVYGPNQYKEKIIPRFCSLIMDNMKCTIHGEGLTKRAFIHVDDVIDAVDIICSKGSKGHIYNVSSDLELSVIDVAKMVVEELKGPEENFENHIEHVRDRPFNDRRYYICSKKLRNLGWVPRRDDSLYLRKFIRHFK